MVANVNVFGGQPGSGDSLYFWSIKHAFCKATFLMRFLWTCLHLLSSLFLQWEQWPVWETWDVSTGYNLALSRLAKIPGALLCLSDPLSCSWSANDQSGKAHRRGGCCLPTEGLWVCQFYLQTNEQSFTHRKYTESSDTLLLRKYEEKNQTALP